MRISVVETNWGARRWTPSEVRNSGAKMNCVDGHPTGKASQRSSEANSDAIVLERGFFFSKRTSIRLRVRGALSCRAGQTVAQLQMSLPIGSCLIGMSLPKGSCLIEDELLEFKDRCLYYDSRVRLPSSKHR